jgi:DNA polymerase/3'-5' exonuclease PolX
MNYNYFIYVYLPSLVDKYYDEISEKIPREKIQQIDIIIQNTVQEINSKFKINLECTIAGSYRRGLPQSGDIDCLLTMKNFYVSDEQIQFFIKKLKKIGLITDDLGWGETKYSGVCVDSNNMHRRIDFEFVKNYKTFYYELLYFTGSQNLNVQMRQRAKEMGYLLNQKGLFIGKKSVPAKSEKEIFDNLEMEYLEPNER